MDRSAWRERLPEFGLGAVRVVVTLLAVAAIVTYGTLAVLHLRYPFDLEWMEGGLAEEARRAGLGLKLYVKPTFEYTPYLYGPVWFWVAGAVGRIAGAGLFAGRLVSVLSSVAVLALVADFVRREGGSKLAGLWAAGLYAACYPLASAFYDLARVDSLFVAFFLGALHLARFRPTPRGRVASAALFTLAFLVKQSVVLAFAPVALHLLLAERRRALWFVVPGILFMGGSVLLLDWIHGGWFSYFVLWLPRQHPWVKAMWTDFWRLDLLAPLGVSCLVGLFYVTVDRGVEGRRFYLAAAAGALAVSWLGRLHAGGWPNVIMPAFALLAILFGLGLQAGRDLGRGFPAPQRRSVELLCLLTAGIQLMVLSYDPRRFIPSAKDRDAGFALVETIRKIPGDVYVPAHTYLSSLAGKRPFAHEMAMVDILGIDGKEPGAELRKELEETVKARKFAAVIADTGFLLKEMEGNYQRKSDPFTDPDVFWPVTGMRTRPKTIYVPRPR
jgi:Dolichyl-phosphate-mannose-protein mannosyltransferase